MGKMYIYGKRMIFKQVIFHVGLLMIENEEWGWEKILGKEKW
jgi:hypothetical protein